MHVWEDARAAGVALYAPPRSSSIDPIPSAAATPLSLSHSDGIRADGAADWISSSNRDHGGAMRNTSAHASGLARAASDV